MKSLLNNILRLKCRVFDRSSNVGICRATQVLQSTLDQYSVKYWDTVPGSLETYCLLQYYVLLTYSTNFKYWRVYRQSSNFWKILVSIREKVSFLCKASSKHEKVKKKSKMNKQHISLWLVRYFSQIKTKH